MNKINNLLIKLSIYILIFFCGLMAQQNDIIQFKEEQLNEKTNKIRVTDIQQDSIGYIWFASNQGVYKYDGIKYKFYETSKDTLSFTFNRITSLHIDNKNNVWIAIKNKLMKYDPIDDKFIHTYTFPSTVNIQDITSNKQNELILSTRYGGIIKYNPQTKIIFDIISDKNIKSSKKMSNRFTFINNNNYWIGTSKGLLFYNASDSIMYCKNNPIFTYYKDNQNNLWLGSQRYLIKFNLKTKKQTNYLYRNGTYGSITNISFKSPSELWVSTYRYGLIIFNTLTNRFLTTTNNNLNITNIVQFYQDRTGTYWIGGVKKLYKSYYDYDIIHFINNKEDINSISDNYIFALCKNDTGNLWCGTYKNNINFIDLKNDTIKRFNLETDFKYPKLLFNPNSSNENITSIYDDNNSNLLIGYSAGLLKINLNTKNVDEIQIDTSKYKRINCIFEDSKKRVWIGNSKGLFSYDKSKFILKKHLSGYRISCITENRNSNIVIGTFSNGVFVYNPEIDSIVNIIDLKIKSFGIKCIFCDSLNNIFIGSKHGLLIYNQNDKTTSYYRDIEGLPSNNILKISQDKDSWIWISTENGLSRFDKKSNKFTDFSSTSLKKSLNYYMSNVNIIDNKYTRNLTQYLKHTPLIFTDDGYLNVGGMNGINRFNPTKLPKKVDHINMTLSGINIYNRPIKYQTYINKKKEYVFSYKDDIITFNFAIISYQDPNANKYAFFLEGYDKTFSDKKSINNITYSNLPPGKYTLKTQCSDYRGFWIDGPSYKIRITPPFWMTYWFYGILIITLIIVIRVGVKLQTQRIINQKELLEYEIEKATKQLTQKEKDLQEINTQLELRVSQRTQKLQETNIQLNKSKEEIEINLSQQSLLADISMKFNSLIDFDSKTNEILSMLGNNTNVSRVYIFEVNETGTHASNTFEWCAPTIHPEKENLQNLSFDIVYNWYPQLFKNEMICANDIDEFDKKTSEFLNQQNIKSIIIFPLFLSEKFYGFIGFDECSHKRIWNNSEINLLKTISNIFSHAFEKRKTENSLIESERTARAILNSSSDAALLLDTNATILSINKTFQKLVDLPHDKIIGTNIKQYLPKDIAEIKAKFFIESIKTKSLVSFEDKSELKYYTNNMCPILDINNNVNSVAVFIQDITKQKEAEIILMEHQQNLEKEVIHRTSELKESNRQLLDEIKTRIKMQKELLKSEREKRENLERLTLQLAHEIKNPLASIKSSSQLVETIQQVKPSKKDTIKHTRIINRNVDICNKVIQDLYTYTHETGFEMHTISVNQIHSNLVNYAKERSENNKNITIKNTIHTNGEKFNIDKFRLMQALKNLINNSFEAIEKSGEINIITKIYDIQNMILTISDTGCGINQKNLSEIFNPFYSTKPTGFGIGLSVVDEIIKKHGGKINVQSKIGNGTNFSIILPIIDNINQEIK